MFCECFASVFQAFCECFASVSLPISTSISTQIDYSVPAHGLHTWTQKSFLSSHIQTGADNFAIQSSSIAFSAADSSHSRRQSRRQSRSRFFFLSPAVSPAVSQQVLLFFSPAVSLAVSPAVSQQILLSLAGSLAGSLARHRLACLTRKRLEGRSFLKPLWVSRPNLFLIIN